MDAQGLANDELHVKHLSLSVIGEVIRSTCELAALKQQEPQNLSRKHPRDFTESTGNLLLANLSMVLWVSPPISSAIAQLWSTVPTAPAFRRSALEIVGHEMVDADRDGFGQHVSQSN